MTLRLNNQQIKGKELKVNIKLPFGDADMSGTGSGTDAAEEGMKAKEMTVNLLIPYENPEWLSDLVNLAESVDENGSRTVYRIGHDAANAMKFYQAKFVGEVGVNEQQDSMAWLVNFFLKEKLSVPERKEQREPLEPAQQQSLTENSEPTAEDENIPPNTQLSTLSRLFTYLDGQAADLFTPSEEDTDETS